MRRLSLLIAVFAAVCRDRKECAFIFDFEKVMGVPFPPEPPSKRQRTDSDDESVAQLGRLVDALDHLHDRLSERHDALEVVEDGSDAELLLEIVELTLRTMPAAPATRPGAS